MLQKIKQLIIPIFSILAALLLRFFYNKGKSDQIKDNKIEELKVENENSDKTIKVLKNSIDMSDEHITNELLKNFSKKEDK